MKRSAFALITITLIICSCKKNNDSPAPSAPQDTLSAGWTKRSASTNARFFDVFFVQNTGFVLDGHQIYRSTNGGTDWVLANSYDNFVNMGMGSASNAIFASYFGKLICTHNGGTTFDTVSVADQGLADVFFVNANIAYAAGKSFWKTTDAGYTWTKLSDFPAGTPLYKTIHFINEQTGWRNDETGIYKTVNGGSTWQSVTTATPFLGAALFFTDAGTGYASSFHAVGKTTNGGASWTTIFDKPSPSGMYIDLHFIDNMTGYYCAGSEIYKTTDGGTNWSRVVKVVDADIIEIHFTDATHGWACGSNGTILKYAP